MSLLHALGYSAALTALLSAASAKASGITPEEGPEDPKRACAAQRDAAPVLTRGDMLTEARAALLACSKGDCPAAIRVECAESFEAVAALIPSVIVSATSHDQDEARVRVIVDGQVVPLRRDGRPIELNPGLHKFRFEAPAQEPVEQQVALRRGQKYRVLAVQFEPLKPAPHPEPVQPSEPAALPQIAPHPEPTPPSRLAPHEIAQRPAPAPPPERALPPEPAPPEPGATPPLEPVPSAERYRPVPVLDYVLGATAVVGLAGVAGFGLSGLVERQSLQSSCAPFCSDTQIGSVRSKLLAADVALGAAILSVAGGVYVYATRPTTERNAPASSGSRGATRSGATLVLAPTASGATLSLEGGL